MLMKLKPMVRSLFSIAVAFTAVYLLADKFFNNQLMIGNMAIVIGYQNPGINSYPWDVVLETLRRAFPRTLILVTIAFVIASVAGILLGTLFSYRGGGRRRTIQVFALAIPASLPDVLVILALQMLMFKLKDAGLPYLSPVGFTRLSNVVLPALSLSIIPASSIARITYNMAIDTYGEKFILTARAKGCREGRIHAVHVWKRIAPSVIDSLSGVIPILISNLIVVELLFYYPGLSYSLFRALDKHDMNTFTAMAGGIAAVYVICSLGVTGVKVLRRLKGGAGA